MLVRLLLVLLVALNIAVGAWLWLGQDDARNRSATDAGVPSLRLLSERPVPPQPVAPSAPASAALATASTSQEATAGAPAASVAEPPPSLPKPTPRPNSFTCISIGPFATPQDMRTARAALNPQAARMRSRQEQTTQSRGWWVYLPASSSREQALEQARRLSAAHIDDYFVVGSGGQPNTISLGLFKDPANARKRRDEVVAAGFSAQMTERTETVPEYWLDLAVADGSRFDWRSKVRSSGVGSHSTGCF